MKATFLKICGILICLSLTVGGCEKDDEPEFSEPATGYIVGSFICEETDGKDGIATGEQTSRGFCILLEDSENSDTQWPMDFYTFDISPDLFDFPEEILVPTNNSEDGGPTFFPNNLQDTFKITFQYSQNKKSEIIHFSCFSYAMFSSFPWDDFSQVSLKNISKTN